LFGRKGGGKGKKAEGRKEKCLSRVKEGEGSLPSEERGREMEPSGSLEKTRGDDLCLVARRKREGRKNVLKAAQKGGTSRLRKRKKAPLCGRGKKGGRDNFWLAILGGEKEERPFFAQVKGEGGGGAPDLG